MKCIIDGCYHKMTRRGSINRKSNSWSERLCPCCLIELIDMDSIIWNHLTSKSGCRQYIGQPEPLPRIIAYRDITEKPKPKIMKKTPWKYTKVNSDKSKVDRSIIF